MMVVTHFLEKELIYTFYREVNVLFSTYFTHSFSPTSQDQMRADFKTVRAANHVLVHAYYTEGNQEMNGRTSTTTSVSGTQ